MATMAQGTISRHGMARLKAAFEGRLHSAYSAAAAQSNTAGSSLVQLSHVDRDRPFDRKGSRFCPARGRVSASRHRFARTQARTHSHPVACKHAHARDDSGSFAPSRTPRKLPGGYRTVAMPELSLILSAGWVGRTALPAQPSSALAQGVAQCTDSAAMLGTATKRRFDMI